jgi:hypothetical protein
MEKATLSQLTRIVKITRLGLMIALLAQASPPSGPVMVAVTLILSVSCLLGLFLTLSHDNDSWPFNRR